MDRETVGLIGVGLLGTALAERLLHAGYPMVGFDIDASKRQVLADLGGRSSASAAEVLDSCARLILALPDSAAVAAVVSEFEPRLRPGQCIIDTTTGDPEPTAVLGARLASRGVPYLDATVVGSSAVARAGDVILLVGGERAQAEACTDLFATLARKWYYLGPCGSGARMKLVVNLVLGLNRAVLAEGLAFARSCGLDPGSTLEVLRAGAAYSRVMDSKGQKMIDHDFEPQARLAQHLKDVRLIIAQAERCGALVPLSELHRNLLEKLANAGLGDADNAAIICAFEGIEPRAE